MYAQTAQRPEAAPQPVGGDEWTAGVLQNTHALRQEVPEPLETAGKWRRMGPVKHDAFSIVKILRLFTFFETLSQFYEKSIMFNSFSF